MVQYRCPACVYSPARKPCGCTTTTNRIYRNAQLARDQRIQGSNDTVLCVALNRVGLNASDAVHAWTCAGFRIFLLGRFVRLLKDFLRLRRC